MLSLRKVIKKTLFKFPLAYALAFRLNTNFTSIKPNMHETNTALHFYSTWLKHFILCNRNNIWNNPDKIIELGPGASIGSGLAAMLCGINKYYAIDVVPYTNATSDLSIFDNIIELFRARADVSENISAGERLEFPSDILTEELLKSTLAPERIQKIKDNIKHMSDSIIADDQEIEIKYITQKSQINLIEEQSIDMLFSSAVLEHVNEVENTYELMSYWLKQNGIVSHFIGFDCHGLAEEWNAHWAFSDWEWQIMTKNMPYLINREPVSTHIELLRKLGFAIVADVRWRVDENDVSCKRTKLFKNRILTNDDLETKGTFIQAIKK